MIDIKKYKQGRHGQTYFRDKIKKDLKLSQVFFVPVCAFGIVYSVYSDNDMRNQVAEIVY
jgi:hypothetical protein